MRGFQRVINVWGADHHGHVARLKGAMDAIGLDGSKLDIVLMQFVRLMQDGQPVKMSKRTGKAISLTDLIDEVPVDAARFLFNLREPNSMVDFDLGLAVEQSMQNPVYYVQYAHARICSLLKKLAEEGVSPRACSQKELSARSRAFRRRSSTRPGATTPRASPNTRSTSRRSSTSTIPSAASRGRPSRSCRRASTSASRRGQLYATY